MLRSSWKYFAVLYLLCNYQGGLQCREHCNQNPQFRSLLHFHQRLWTSWTRLGPPWRWWEGLSVEIRANDQGCHLLHRMQKCSGTRNQHKYQKVGSMFPCRSAPLHFCRRIPPCFWNLRMVFHLERLHHLEGRVYLGFLHLSLCQWLGQHALQTLV